MGCKPHNLYRHLAASIHLLSQRITPKRKPDVAESRLPGFNGKRRARWRCRLCPARCRHCGRATDLMMPVMARQSMIHALLTINPLVKIIVTSGLDANGAEMEGDSGKHFRLNPIRQLRKPRLSLGIFDSDDVPSL